MRASTEETGMVEYAKGQGQRPAQASADNTMTPEHDGARKVVFQTPQIGGLEETDGHTLSGSSGGQQWEMTPTIARDEAMETQAANWRPKEVMETFYNTTPRSIFVCLDLNLGQIKFWLNEHKMSHKILELNHQPGQ